MASSDNPADLPSRGIPTSVLRQDKMWWQGPDWISLPTNDWPTWDNTPQRLQDVPILPDKPCVVFESKLITLSGGAKDSILNDLVNKVSTLSHFLRVTAWIRRFTFNLRSSHRRCGPLSSSEIESTRVFLEKKRSKTLL